jgi:hypothetical protein
MTDKDLDTAARADTPPSDIHTADTLDGSLSTEVFRLRAVSSRHVPGVLRDTSRVPRLESELAQIDENDFKQYVLGTIDAAIALTMSQLEVLDKAGDVQFYIREFEKQSEIENGDFDVRAITSFISTRITYLDALKILFPSLPASGNEDSTPCNDFDFAKQILEEVQEKLQQWMKIR